MIINYNVDKFKYKATFCYDKESPDIYKFQSTIFIVIKNAFNYR